MIETGDDGVIQDGDSLAKWLSWVIKESVEVRVSCETKSCDTLMGTIDDEEGAIRECWTRTMNS